MTISKLSLLTGISEVSLRKMEWGKSKLLLRNIRKISTVLGVSIAYLGCFENLPESTYGEKLFKARQYHAHTQKELSKLLGIDDSIIRKWENDEGLPSFKHKAFLDNYLKILDS